MRLLPLLVTLFSCTLGAPSFGQNFFFGAGLGTLWEKQSEVAPSKEWEHTNRSAKAFFAALPVDADTRIRVERVVLPRDVQIGGEPWRAELVGWTAGVDYVLPGVLGQAIFGAGAGSYKLDLTRKNSPPGAEASRFGWYVKVGEWFPFSKRVGFAGEIFYHRTNHRGSPQLLVASGYLVVGF